MNDRITAGAASLMGSLTAGFAYLRWHVTPAPERGRHRAQRVGTVLDEVSLDELLDGGEVEANDFAYCPDEARTTFHAIRTDGSRRCWTCTCETAAGAA